MTDKEKFNIEVGDIIIKDVAEKIGGVFGENGRKIGEIIDICTKDITIKILDIIEFFK